MVLLPWPLANPRHSLGTTKDGWSSLFGRFSNQKVGDRETWNIVRWKEKSIRHPGERCPDIESKNYFMLPSPWIDNERSHHAI